MAHSRTWETRLAETIAERLAELGISHRQAATDAHMAEATLRRRLTGRVAFQSNEIDALARVLGMSLVELVTEAEAAA